MDSMGFLWLRSLMAQTPGAEGLTPSAEHMVDSLLLARWLVLFVHVLLSLGNQGGC